VSRRGFTLVELMVALLVAGMVALLAERVFASTVDASRAVGGTRDALDREMNARRMLATAIASVEVGRDGAGFEGRPGTMRFTSWLQVPEGWHERASVDLDLEGNRFVLRAAGRQPVTLAKAVAALEFDYLVEPGAESRWVREWLSPVSAPLAVRVRLIRTRDTPGAGDSAVYLVKARG
jgi:prepilin-type N-terminal cleavage/methylation domain-containing protein